MPSSPLSLQPALSTPLSCSRSSPHQPSGAPPSSRRCLPHQPPLLPPDLVGQAGRPAGPGMLLDHPSPSSLVGLENCDSSASKRARALASTTPRRRNGWREREMGEKKVTLTCGSNCHVSSISAKPPTKTARWPNAHDFNSSWFLSLMVKIKLR
jgi:hypothetical protein